MNLSNRRIAINTIYMYFRSILILFVSLYSSRVLLEQLGQSDFGVYNVVAGFVTLLTFLNTAMVNSTQRFLNNCLGIKDDSLYIKVFRTSLFIQFIFAILFFIIAESIGRWFVAYKLNVPFGREQTALFVYQLSVCSFALKIFQAPYSAVIVSKERMNFYAFQGILESLLLLLITIALKYTAFDKLKLYSVYLCLVSAIILVVNVIYVRHIIKNTLLIPLYDRTVFRKLMAFSGWSIFGSFSTIVKSQGLNILLNLFFNVIINAARGIASQVFSGVSTFIANFQTAFKPQLVQSYAEGDYERYMTLTYWGTKISVFIMWIFSLPIILSIDQILILWLGSLNVPSHAANFTIIALLTGLVDAYASPIAMAVSANGNIRNFQIAVSCFKLLVIPIAFILCKFGCSPELILISGLLLDILAIFVRLYYWKRIVFVDSGDCRGFYRRTRSSGLKALL